MESHTTNMLLMIRPVAFGFNTQTAVNNYFMTDADISNKKVQALALKEFDGMVSQLRDKGIRVLVIEDNPKPHTPDSIFPNNWISFHHRGKVCLYPMFAENRRHERRWEILKEMDRHKVLIRDIIDYSHFEKEGLFLEGTGSMVLDRKHHLAYAALSERTHLSVLNHFCKDFGYKAVTFHANQQVGSNRLPIYHTNVMLCITSRYAIVCLDAIDDPAEYRALCDSLAATSKELIPISERQMNAFAGNMLELRKPDGSPLLVCSSTAWESLLPHQQEQLMAMNEVLAIAVPTIESIGGGSVRCMMAEIFNSI